MDFLFSVSYQLCTVEAMSAHDLLSDGKPDTVLNQMSLKTKLQVESYFARDITCQSIDPEMGSMCADISDSSSLGLESGCGCVEEEEELGELDICDVDISFERRRFNGVRMMRLDAKEQAIPGIVAEEFYTSEEMAGWDGI